jgi:hypothetical protein
MSDGDTRASDIGMVREIEERVRTRILALEQDADRLQSRIRLLTIGLVIALALAAVVAVNPGLLAVRGFVTGPRVVRAQQILLQDAEGKPRGDWSVDDQGNARFTLLDRQGRPRLSLAVLSGGFPGLSLINANGLRRAAFGLLPDETTSLVFADPDGVPRAVLGLTRGDAAHLVFADADGVSRVSLGVDGLGQESVILPEVSEPGR